MKDKSSQSQNYFEIKLLFSSVGEEDMERNKREVLVDSGETFRLIQDLNLRGKFCLKILN